MPTEAEALQTALNLHQAGQFSQAEQIYRLILESNPEQPDALHLLGVLALQSGSFDTAIENIRRAIDAGSGPPMYHNNLGKAYQSAGRTAEARAAYERALALDPDFVLAHFNLGTLEEQQQQPAVAQRHYERAVALAPNHALAHNQLGVVLRSQGKLEQGIAEFQKALACDPNCQEARGNLAAATAALEAAARTGGAAPSYLQLGCAYAAAGHWDRAIESFQAVLAQTPDDARACVHLAEALAGKGDAAAAGRAFEQALDHRPGDVSALLAYAAFLRAQAQPARALDLADRAVRTDPSSAWGHYQRAAALRDLARFAEAEQALRDALRHRPDFTEAHAELSILRLKNASHRHRVIFIHIPKNGGTSIKKVLDLPGGGHPTWREYADHYPQVWRDYASFAVVRNTWDRAVSAYFHARMKESYWHNEQTGLHPDYLLLREKSFAECVALLRHDREKLKHLSWVDQSEFIVDTHSPAQPVVVGDVLRFETLNVDFDAFCRRRGIRCPSLPTENTSQRSRDYRAYYNDETRRMIAEVYRADIEKFGYSF